MNGTLCIWNLDRGQTAVWLVVIWYFTWYMRRNMNWMHTYSISWASITSNLTSSHSRLCALFSFTYLTSSVCAGWVSVCVCVCEQRFFTSAIHWHSESLFPEYAVTHITKRGGVNYNTVSLSRFHATDCLRVNHTKFVECLYLSKLIPYLWWMLQKSDVFAQLRYCRMLCVCVIMWVASIYNV